MSTVALLAFLVNIYILPNYIEEYQHARAPSITQKHEAGDDMKRGEETLWKEMLVLFAFVAASFIIVIFSVTNTILSLIFLISKSYRNSRDRLFAIVVLSLNLIIIMVAFSPFFGPVLLGA